MCILYMWFPVSDFICASQCWGGQNGDLHRNRCYAGYDGSGEEGRRLWVRHADQSSALPDGPNWCKLRQNLLLKLQFILSSFTSTFKVNFFFCGTQNEKFWRLCWMLFACYYSEWWQKLSSFKKIQKISSKVFIIFLQMQYVFIFQALLEHYLYGDTELEVTSLESHLAKLYAPLPGGGGTGLEAEFKVGTVSLSVIYFLWDHFFKKVLHVIFSVFDDFLL